MHEKIDEILADPTSVKGVKVLTRGHTNILSLRGRSSPLIAFQCMTIWGCVHMWMPSRDAFDTLGLTTFMLFSTSASSCMDIVVIDMILSAVLKVQNAPYSESFITNSDKKRQVDLVQHLADAHAREITKGNGLTRDEPEDVLDNQLSDYAIIMEATVFV
ncbi:hypothetical protein DFQ26_005657 [Actinomortierella ambigua]|nr:hypothetical protein DFQ26_005657 [Actinomortierella ambigua]